MLKYIFAFWVHRYYFRRRLKYTKIMGKERKRERKIKREGERGRERKREKDLKREMKIKRKGERQA